jgi:hypothetical protein
MRILRLVCILIVIALSITFLHAQNLVSNPSFEDHLLTECTPTEISFAFGSYAINWSCPNWGTSDVFSSSGELPDSCFSSVPNNGSFPPHLGSQLPRTGQRMAGIIHRTTNFTIEEDLFYTWREYIQAQLTEALVPGEYYRFEMFISFGEASALAANNIGVAFVKEQQYFQTYSIIPLKPIFTEKRIITDSLNWTKIAFSFKASDTSKYLIIGNYYYDSDTDYILNPFHNPEIKTSYYFIDDVSLVNIPCESFDFTGDLTICQGDSAIVVAATNYKNVVWEALSEPGVIVNLGSTLRAKPDQTISYKVKGLGECNLSGEDTITVVVNPAPLAMIGADTSLCKGSSLLLDAGEGTRYTWQDNTHYRFLNVTETGRYSVQVMNEFRCQTYKEINVIFDIPPVVNLGNDTLLCDEFLLLNARQGFKSYLWSTGSEDSSILVSDAGKYWVTIKNACGEDHDTINAYFMKDIFIPNVITLNDDDLNAQFKIKDIGPEATGRLKMYNRWGKEFLSDDHYKGDWPKESDSVPNGIYYYILTYAGCKTFRGWLHVLTN